MAARPRPRIFLDSNVIISGLYSSNGAPGEILERFVKGEIRLVISQQVLEEVVRNIQVKLPEALAALETLLVNAPPEVAKDPDYSAVEHWTDRLSVGDAAILTAAISSGPDYFVTGDNHFLRKSELIKKTGLTVVTPAQFLELMREV